MTHYPIGYLNDCKITRNTLDKLWYITTPEGGMLRGPTTIERQPSGQMLPMIGKIRWKTKREATAALESLKEAARVTF